MIAIVDYGAGNIFSVKNALDDAAAIQAADAIILPGVGAFPSAMQMLKERNLVSVLQTESKKKPFLGICLGMQLIFEKGYEFEACDGLGLIPGTVEKIPANGLIIPHMDWNIRLIAHCCTIWVKKHMFISFILIRQSLHRNIWQRM